MKYLKPFHALATTLILSGLLPGCAVERKCEAGGCADDAKITASVQALINQHPDLGPPDTVRVQTLGHVVSLSGEVSEGLMKQTAEDTARQSPGVTQVVNNIFVAKWSACRGGEVQRSWSQDAQMRDNYWARRLPQVQALNAQTVEVELFGSQMQAGWVRA